MSVIMATADSAGRDTPSRNLKAQCKAITVQRGKNAGVLLILMMYEQNTPWSSLEHLSPRSLELWLALAHSQLSVLTPSVLVAPGPHQQCR